MPTTARKWICCASLVLPLVAVGCNRQSSEKARSDELITKVENMGGEASREPNQPDGPVTIIDLSEKKVDDNKLAELTRTHSLSHLRSLVLDNTQVTGTGLAHLKGLNDLERLDIGNTKINDGDLEPLTGLPNLKDLGLDGTQITDAGLEYLKAVPNLETLDLAHTTIDDAGLKPLESLRHLSTLKLTGTKVTDKGIEAFKKARPECTIDRDR